MTARRRIGLLFFYFSGLKSFTNVFLNDSIIVESIIKYLSSDIFPGIGLSTAAKIVNNNPNILIIQGDSDRVIPANSYLLTEETLKKLGYIK